MNIILKLLFGPVVILGLSNAVQAQEMGFDPRQNCAEILGNADETTLAMVGAWTFGFLASKQSDPRPVDLDNVKVILRNLNTTCTNGNAQSLLEVVSGSSKASSETPGSEAHARSLLMKFFEPDADLVALTSALFPTEEEVHMVYNDPVASKLAAGYAEAFKPGIKFGPKPDQNALLTVHATTAQLKNGDAVLREFPGGYKDIVQYFKSDVPIVRFKFVKEGETLGLAFDGLVFVNNHWVIMPKPWRSLE